MVKSEVGRKKNARVMTFSKKKYSKLQTEQRCLLYSNNSSVLEVCESGLGATISQKQVNSYFWFLITTQVTNTISVIVIC